MAGAADLSTLALHLRHRRVATGLVPISEA
jgi:hypothetical protein